MSGFFFMVVFQGGINALFPDENSFPDGESFFSQLFILK